MKRGTVLALYPLLSYLLRVAQRASGPSSLFCWVTGWMLHDTLHSGYMRITGLFLTMSPCPPSTNGRLFVVSIGVGVVGRQTRHIGTTVVNTICYVFRFHLVFSPMDPFPSANVSSETDHIVDQ
jgi:hypothetical protein